MKKCGLILACVAGSTVSSLAFAQSDTDGLPPLIEMSVNDIQGGDYVRGTFGDRVDLLVYSIGLVTENGGTFNAPGDSTALYDDVVFGGPGATGDVLINGLAWGVWYPANGPGQLYMKVTFFDGHNNAAPAASPPYSGATVEWLLNIGVFGGPGVPAAGGFFPDAVTFGGAGALLTDAFIGVDRTVGCKMELYTDAAFTTRAIGHAPISRGGYPNHIVGDSDVFRWFAPVAPGDGAIINTAGTYRTGAAGAERGAYLKLQGTGYNPPAPTPDYALGCIADGTVSTSVNTALAGAEPNVVWASLCLAGDALDNAGITGEGQFFDAWAEGTSDVSMGLYDAVSGALIAVDQGDGPDGNGQFSFGIGRRAAVGNGKQFDGNNYYLGTGLANGNYLLAIAPSGSSFTSGWGVTPGVGGGVATLKTNTNVNGAPLAAAVVPTIDADLDAGGPLLSPGAALPPVAREPYQVSWFKFTTCKPSSDLEPVSVDLLGSDVDPAGSSHAVFDSNGNLVASASADPGNAADLLFDGTNVLPAGTYYIAQTWENPNYSSNPGTTGRFHVRSQAGNNGFGFAGTLNIFWTECGGGTGCGWDIPGGCASDQDADGDVDSDDINLFFAEFENGGSCGDHDGDQDTDSDDITLFFAAFENGAC